MKEWFKTLEKFAKMKAIKEG